MRVALIGHQLWASLTLDALLAGAHEVVGAVAETDEFYAREADYAPRFARHGLYGSFKDTARRRGLEVFQPLDINAPSSLERFAAWRPDVALILNYHSIIREPLLSRYLFVNIHGALLPQYRGRSSVNWAIINGEAETGVTVHYIDAKVDTGDIIVQRRIPIYEQDTAADVLQRMLPIYAGAALEALDGIGTGTASRIRQDPSKAAYYRARKPDDGAIDWRKGAREIHNWVRALSDPFPGAFTTYEGARLTLWRASLPPAGAMSGAIPGQVVAHGAGTAEVATVDGLIQLSRVQRVGGAEEEGSCLQIGSVLGT